MVVAVAVAAVAAAAAAVVDTAPAPVLVEPHTKTIPTNHCQHLLSIPTKQAHYHQNQSTICPVMMMMSQNRKRVPGV